jgi:hypothetical protein
MDPILATLEAKAAPWGRIAAWAGVLALVVGVLVLREKLKASRAETAAALALVETYKGAVHQLEDSVRDQNQAVETWRVQGEAQASRVQAAAVTGGRIRAVAEESAQRLLVAPVKADPDQERERAAAVLAAIGRDWREGR